MLLGVWSNRNPCASLVEMQNGAGSMEISPGVSQKIKNRSTIWSSNSTPGYTPKRTESRVSKRDLYPHVHSSITQNSKRQKQPKCLSRDERINKVWLYTHNEILLSPRKKGNSDKCCNTVKDIMLSEISQPQKDTHCGPRQKEQCLPGSGQREEGESWGQFQFCKMKKFWKLTAQWHEYINTTEPTT